MSPTPTPANIFSLRARDHEYAAPAAISWLADTTPARLERVKGRLREYEDSERHLSAYLDGTATANFFVTHATATRYLR